MTIQEIQSCTEYQTFDRKSIRVEAKALAVTIIAMANADGGRIALGVEDDGELTGVDYHQEHLNELLRAPYDFCTPSIEVKNESIEITDSNNRKNHIIIINIASSIQVHANQADEVFYRVGDKSKKLNFEQRTQLVYAKGGRYYEDVPVIDSSIEDLDAKLIEEYLKKIDYRKGAMAFVRENGYVCKRENFKGETTEVLNAVAVLLFAKNPQRFFQRARVRVIRYEGYVEKVGTEMNVVKDEVFTGGILDLTNSVLQFVKTQIKEHSFLGTDGRFVTVPQYPDFVGWK